MGQRCEVCENFRPEGDLEPGRKLVEGAYGERNVVMCAGHAQIAENAEIVSSRRSADFYRESHRKKKKKKKKKKKTTARSWSDCARAPLPSPRIAGRSGGASAMRIAER